MFTSFEKFCLESNIDPDIGWNIIIEDIESNFGEIALERKPEVTSYNPIVTTNPKYGETKEDYAARLKAEYDTILPTVELAKNELERLIKSVAKHDATFLITPFSIKPFKSLLEKIYDRGKRAEKITDVLRCAILARSENDVNEIVRLINRNHHVYEYEFKNKGGDPKYGYYGSHHFLVKLKAGDFLAEIQVMTNRLWAFKEQAHKIYEKYRASDLNDDFEKAKKESKSMFSKGNIPVFKKK